MNRKIVFIDIDGTLFDNMNDLIHQSTIDAIKKLKENDIYICIASGRSMALGDEVFLRYQIDFDGYVLINGQFVVFNNEIIYKKPLNKNFIEEFIIECKKLDLDYGFVTNDETFVSSRSNKVIKTFADFKIKVPRLITEGDLHKDIFQGLFFDEASINYFSQKFKSYVKFIGWLGNGADIIDKNASKAIGIAKICEKLGIKRENVYAIGDSYNDIEMIEYASIGIAMGNAKDSLKEVADYVTDDISADGLANALKKFNLI